MLSERFFTFVKNTALIIRTLSYSMTFIVKETCTDICICLATIVELGVF